MPTDEQECSPLDFFLSRYGYTFEQTFFLAYSHLREDKRPPLVKMNTESLYFTAWDILPYLRTSRVPREKLEALYRIVTQTSEGIPTRRGWVKLCIAITPPFLTQEPHQVLDMRPAFSNWPGRPCKDYAGLLTHLCMAFLDYEAKVKVLYLNELIEYHVIQKCLIYMHIGRNNFQLQRMRERLPPP